LQEKRVDPWAGWPRMLACKFITVPDKLAGNRNRPHA
jgi:hypothetical protein